ncbi:MAG: ribose-5-phosphate isomerase RpiA [Methylococcaceae bacterium]|jgi:ribose 5-phosphate isomerase A
MNEKQLIALQAAKQVEDGMLVGLGTGSTANLFIEALAIRVQEEGLQVKTVASSMISSIMARQVGLPQLAIEQINQLDLYVDGADEVAPDLTLLKGRGADLVKEKLLAKASDKFLVLADESKFVDWIGQRYPIPIEVMPFAWQLVKASLEAIGGRGELRKNSNQDSLVVTSHGSLVLDMVFEVTFGSKMLSQLLSNTPGVVEHGIFIELATSVITVKQEQVQEFGVSLS